MVGVGVRIPEYLTIRNLVCSSSRRILSLQPVGPPIQTTSPLGQQAYTNVNETQLSSLFINMNSQ